MGKYFLDIQYIFPIQCIYHYISFQYSVSIILYPSNIMPLRQSLANLAWQVNLHSVSSILLGFSPRVSEGWWGEGNLGGGGWGKLSINIQADIIYVYIIHTYTTYYTYIDIIYTQTSNTGCGLHNRMQMHYLKTSFYNI